MGSPTASRARCRVVWVPRMRHWSLRAHTCQFGAVVHSEMLGGSPLCGEALQHTDDTVSVDAAGYVHGQSLACELACDVEQLEPTTLCGLIELEVQRPHMVRPAGRVASQRWVSLRRRRFARRCGGRCRPSSLQMRLVRLGLITSPSRRATAWALRYSERG